MKGIYQGKVFDFSEYEDGRGNMVYQMDIKLQQGDRAVIVQVPREKDIEEGQQVFLFGDIGFNRERGAYFATRETQVCRVAEGFSLGTLFEEVSAAAAGFSGSGDIPSSAPTRKGVRAAGSSNEDVS